MRLTTFNLHFRQRTRRSTESEAVTITNLIRHSVKRSDISEAKCEDDRKCFRNANMRNIKLSGTVNLRNLLTNKGLRNSLQNRKTFDIGEIRSSLQIKCLLSYTQVYIS